MMVEAGISHVRIGEFGWSRIEPEPGKTDFGWLERAFEMLHKHGLRIVLGMESGALTRRRATVGLEGLRCGRGSGQLFPLASAFLCAGADARGSAVAERRAQ
ncbi:beta-galactosidase [Mesorhizobium sp. 10J20-29]